MLGKMLIHGLVGAAVIGSAAAVFAQAKDNGYLKPDALTTVAPAKMEQGKSVAPVAVAPAATDNRGYIVDRDRARKSEHRREGRRHHDDDDD